MKKNKIVALIVLGIILLQIVIPSLADIDWNVVFAEEINTWDISQNGDGSVMATLSDDGTLTISGNGEMKDWRNSSDGAWYDNREIKNVIINNGVTSIGKSAFSYCSNLISITIPNSVTSIGGKAFVSCRSLTSITIPDSVTSIGGDAFGCCESLTSINVDSNNEKYMSDNGVLYTKDKKTLIQYPSKKEGTEYLILQGVESIGEFAFSDCTSLTNITIPNSVTSIGVDAFYKCTSLTNITIPNSVTSIGGKAFIFCSSLTSITISDSVTSIGGDAFGSCESLTSINVDSNNEKYMSDNGVLYTKDKKTLIQYPSKKEGTEYLILQGVESIGESAFNECTGLTNITIPDSVTSIGNFAFCECTSLTRIIIPDSVTSIGNFAFCECTSLTRIIIPDSVTSIGNFAFSYCTSLTSITISNSVTSIGKYAFKYCSNLTSITIPSSVISIREYAFECCSNLTSITIPSSVTSIGGDAFGSCESLTSINVDSNNEKYMSDNGVLYTKDKKTLIQYPSKKEGTEYLISQGVESIGDHAFEGCENLINITIPDSVTSIGLCAFEGCSSLTNITIPNGVTSIMGAFEGCSSLTNITIPNGVTSIGFCAFYNCTSLTSITIPNSVTSIGDYTFGKCDSLSVLCKRNSYAEQYAKENNIKYVIDDSVPTIKNVTGNEKWTKDKVTLTISAEDSLSGLATEAYSFDNGQTWQKENTKTYTENIQGVIIKVRDAVGNIAIQEIGTIKIDNQAPTIKNVTGNEKWTKDKVILTVNAEDSLSGLATEAYSFDNGQTWQKENTKTYTENTQGIIIKVRDAVGNVATYKTIDINNILKIEISNYEKITKDNNEYLTKIEANTTIAQLKEKIKTNGTIKVLKDNNEITDTNTLVGTGMQIQIETEKYIAIVKADLNGDGKIGLSDLSNIKFSLIGKKQLSIEAQIAGDINGDGKVSLSDMAKLKMYLVGKVNI